MKKKHNVAQVITIGLLFASASFAVEIHSINAAGRMVQLDGFLLEWNKADAKAWGKGGTWQWDAINTKEGVTGYFKSVKPFRCGAWTFTFLPRQLSPYVSMKLSSAPTATQTFYRVSRDSAGPIATVVAEWIIPWDSLGLDSTRAYRIGVTGIDLCGDTLEPMILTGHALSTSAPSPWSKVYSKGILLAVLLLMLFYLQRSAKKKSNRLRKKAIRL